MNYQELIDLVTLAGRLKNLKRTGWIEAGLSNPESVADHTYRVSLLAMILSDYNKLDTEKVLKISLIHDLHESIVGDLTPFQKKDNHIETENRAMEKVLSLLPQELKAEYSKLWYGYQKRASDEAELVYAADKLEMIIQAYEYYGEKSHLKDIERFFETEVPEDYKNLHKAIIERYSQEQ